MAAGDLIGVEVPAIGNRLNLTFESMSTGGTWDLGPWTDNAPTGASIVLTVTCPGYDGTGSSDPKTRTIYGVPHQISLAGAGHGVMRKPWVGTGDPVPDETDSSGDIVAVIFLSGVLHASDAIANISVAEGTYNDGSIDNSAYDADPTSILTYSTTRAYPEPIYSTDSVDGAMFGDLIDADFRLAGWARSLYGVAAVRFTVTDESANEIDVYVTEQALRYRTNGNGRPIFNHRSDPIAISTFAQGDALTLRARVYPVIGDVVFDSDDYTAEAVGYGRNLGTAICNKTGALTVEKFVDLTNGDNGNSGDSEGDAYQTVVTAVQAGANLIRLSGEDHSGTIDPGVRRTADANGNNVWIQIRPFEAEDATTTGLLLASTSGSTDIARLQVLDVTIKASDANAWWTGSSEDLLRATRVVFDRNGQTDAGAGRGFNNFPWLSFEECSGDCGAKWEFHAPGTSGSAVRIDGTDMESEAAGSQRMQYVTLCAGADLNNLGLTHGSAEMAHENIMIQNVACWDVDIAATTFNFGSYEMSGFWAENVVVEVQDNTAQCFAISTNVAAQHVVYMHTAQKGQRSAQFYNDTGTNNFLGEHCVSRLNYCEEYGTKHDDFTTQNAARVGHWEHMMGVESGWDYTYDPAFPRQFAGLYSFKDDGTGAEAATFVHDASNSSRLGDGTGNGDYRDANTTTNRLLYTPALWEQLVPYDRTGRSRGTDCVSAGGYMYRGPDLPVPNAPSSLAEA